MRSIKKMVRAVISYVKTTDRWLWLFCLGFSAFSAVLILGIARTGMFSDVGNKKVLIQIAAAGIGAVAAVIISKIDYHTLIRLWKLHSVAAYLLVCLTFIIGTGTAERMADKSWFMLPGGLSFQPSELLKISFIVTFAYHLHLLRDQINRPQNVLALCLHGAAPVLLIHFQGDDGSALVFLFIFLAMLFAAGLSFVYILPALGAGIVATPLIWFFFLNGFQKERVLALFDPAANPLGVIYQQYNAKLAIGSGQIWGKGIFSSAHKYVPKAHNDFIFSFIGESLGFVGCFAVVLGLTILCIKILLNGLRSHDLQGQLICVGVFAMIASQSIINIGMCISLLPVIGITLPLLSSGGSSIAITYMGIGLVLSVYMHTSQSLFSKP